MTETERVTDKTLRAWLNAGAVHRGIGGGLNFVATAAGALKAAGAEEVVAYCTHGVLSGGAVARVEGSQLAELVITDSIQPTPEVAASDRIRTLTIAPLLGEAIKRIADETSHHVQRLFDNGGVVPVGLTTSSEFGGLNVSITKLNGVAHNPWNFDKTVGGSSGGSAAAVSGGHVSLACGGDGGGSIRIPAGYTGLLGMKGTFGRISRGPSAYARPNTVVLGNVSRSVRDSARYFDVCGGVDTWDPTSLPVTRSYEKGLGTQDLAGRKVTIVP